MMYMYILFFVPVPNLDQGIKQKENLRQKRRGKKVKFILRLTLLIYNF